MENINQIESDILTKIKNVSDHSSYEKIKTEIFGKKGIITELFKKIENLDQDQRKNYASKLNDLKIKATEILEKKLVDFGQSEINEKLKKNMPTIPSSVKDEIECNIFLRAKNVESFSKLRDLKDNF